MSTATISRSIAINVSADEVWAKTAEDFGGVGNWISGINDVIFTPASDGEALGTERVCTTSFGETREIITIYDEVNRHFAYEVVGLPPVIAHGVNNWLITSKGENLSSVEIRFEIEFAPMADEQMKLGVEQQFGSVIQQAVEDLKHYAETGEPHPRKLAQIEQQ